MHGKRTTRGALLALGTALVGCGSSPVAQGLVIRDDVADQVYIDAALETEFDSVGRIFTNAGQCTATLIAPDIILTAAHCFGATTLTPTANTFQLQVADPENPGQSVTASVSLAGSTVDIHPGWTGDFNTGVDLALVYLASPITEVAPNQISFATPEEVETQTGTAVGMGRTGDGVTGAVAGTEGTKRAGENRIDSYQTLAGSSVEYFLADFDEPRVIFNQALPTEFAVANGDSGGPLLVADAVTGENRITAVGSFISGSDGAADSD
ncbi:MAG: trypsin-like serine protease [Planctomycetota bacterium]